jgi:hypothetical protein
VALLRTGTIAAYAQVAPIRGGAGRHRVGRRVRAGQLAAGLVVPGFEAANYRHRHFRRVCRAARIGEQWRPKELRDGYAGWLLSCGIQLGCVSRQVGHTDAAVTARHYARRAGDDPYRLALEVGPGEVPADLLARLSRTGLANGPPGPKEMWLCPKLAAQRGEPAARRRYTALSCGRVGEARNTKRPKPCDSGRFDVVAGGRYVRVCRLPVALLLPVVGRVECRAA